MADSRPKLGDRGRYEQLVIDALAEHDSGLTINEISDRCGGSVSATSLALVSLEADGSGRFHGGRWSLRARKTP
jgi:DNA-binding IclR family transcriptional regulator